MAGKMPAHQMWLGAPVAYYADLDARDEIAIARSLGVPILILHGSQDYHSIDKDIEAWQRGLRGIDRVTVVQIPKLTHFFIPLEGKPKALENMTPGHVDPAVIAAITNFVQQ